MRQSNRIYDNPADIPPEELYPFTNDSVFSLVMHKPEICMGILELLLPGEEFTGLHIEENPLLAKGPNGEPTPASYPGGPFASGNAFAQGKPFASGRPFAQDSPFASNNPFTQGDLSSPLSIESQPTLQFGPEARGVRFDVWAKTSGHRIAVEMQTYVEPDLGRRCRYYHGTMDTDCLRRGVPYNKLPVNYVIFICTYDPFKMSNPDKAGKYMYRFQSYDIKNNLLFDEGRYTIIVNTACEPAAAPEALRPLYAYIRDPAQVNGDKLIRELDMEVRRFNTADWRRMHMTLGEKMDRRYEDGLKDGVFKGEAAGAARINKLNELLLAAGRQDDIARSVQDPSYQTKLLEEFGLKKIRYQ